MDTWGSQCELDGKAEGSYGCTVVMEVSISVRKRSINEPLETTSSMSAC